MSPGPARAPSARRAPTVIHWLASSLRHRTFLTLLVATELVDDLREPGPWVVLAPSDEAFARLPRAWLHELLSERRAEELVDLVENHVCLRAAGGGPLVSLLGERVTAFPPPAGGPEGGRVVTTRSCANGSVVEVDRIVVPRGTLERRRP